MIESLWLRCCAETIFFAIVSRLRRRSESWHHGTGGCQRCIARTRARAEDGSTESEALAAIEGNRSGGVKRRPPKASRCGDGNSASPLWPELVAAGMGELLMMAVPHDFISGLCAVSQLVCQSEVALSCLTVAGAGVPRAARVVGMHSSYCWQNCLCSHGSV